MVSPSRGARGVPRRAGTWPWCGDSAQGGRSQCQQRKGTSHAMAAYLNPQPVPPRTMAATSTAPAMEPIMILVPLGPVTEGTGRRGQGHMSVGETTRTWPQGSPSTVGTWAGGGTRPSCAQWSRGTGGGGGQGHRTPWEWLGTKWDTPARGDWGQRGHGEPVLSPLRGAHGPLYRSVSPVGFGSGMGS